jgi:hypothetical protein
MSELPLSASWSEQSWPSPQAETPLLSVSQLAALQVSVTGWVQQPSGAMAKGASSAKRTNRVISLLVALSFIGAGLVAGFVKQSTTPSETASTTPKRPDVTGTGIRPAESGSYNFWSGLGREQFDFKMKSLNCADMNKELSLDLCAVTRTSHGDFMLTGIEPYDYGSFIDFEFSLFALHTDAGVTRAVTVLNGEVGASAYDDQMRLDIYRTLIDGDEVLLLHKRPVDSSVDGFDNLDEVFIIAASPTGAPTAVAKYSGPHIEFESDGKNIYLYWKRYGPKGTGGDEGWITVAKLFPSDREVYGWNEHMTSAMLADQKPGKTAAGTTVTLMTMVDTYTFPDFNDYGGSSNGKSKT